MALQCVVRLPIPHLLPASAQTPRKEPQTDEKSHEQGQDSLASLYAHTHQVYVSHGTVTSVWKKKSWRLTIKNKAPPPDCTKPVKRRKKSLVCSESGNRPDVRSTSRHTRPGCHQRTCTADSSPREWSQSQNLPQSPHARRTQISCPSSLWSSWQRSGER